MQGSIYGWRVIGEDAGALRFEAVVRFERQKARDYRLAIAGWCFVGCVLLSVFAALV